MDPAVVELMAKMQCAESEAQAALTVTHGQAEEAVRLLRRSVFAIKGRFKSDLRKVYGIFIVFLDAETENVLRSHVVLSKEGWIYNIDLNQGVMELEDYIYHTEFRIETIPTLTKDLNDHFKEKLRFDLLKSILAAIVADQPGDIVELMRGMIASQLADRELDMVIKTEKISRVRFEKLEKNQPKEKSDAAAAPADGEAPADDSGAGAAEGEAKEKVLILKTDVVLAPTNGTRVVDLKLGDKIYLKIIDNSPQGRYIANLLKGDSPTPVPVLVPIEELTHTDSGRCSIITKFGPGVFGRAVVNEGLMIKVEGTGEHASESAAPEPSDNLLPIILGGGLLLMVLLFIIYFFVFRKL